MDESSPSPAATLLRKVLAGPGAGAAWAILDGAMIPNLPEVLDHYAESSECLYRDALSPGQRRVAPYLVRLEMEGELFAWLTTHAWESNCGVFCSAATSLIPLRSHFRKLVKVNLADEPSPAYFRFYDPRVLRTYLPCLRGEELEDFMGPVQRFVMAGEKPGMLLAFQIQNGALAVQEWDARHPQG